MATSINKGTDVQIWNFELNATTDTGVMLNTRFVNSLIIQCRTAVDIYLRKEQGDTEYFTIKSGTVLHLDVSNRELVPLWLKSASTTPVAEIIGYKE